MRARPIARLYLDGGRQEGAGGIIELLLSRFVRADKEFAF